MYALKKAVKINFKDGILKNLHKIDMKPKMPSQIRRTRKEISGSVNKIYRDYSYFCKFDQTFYNKIRELLTPGN